MMKNEIMNTPKCRKMNTQSEMDRDWFKRATFHYLVKFSAEQGRATWNLPPNSCTDDNRIGQRDASATEQRIHQ
jgi:hypothetical protein